MTQIFQPRGVPFYGNSGQVDGGNLSKSFQQLQKLYGNIYRLNLMGESNVVVGGYEIANDVYSEKYFSKVPAGSLLQTRNGVGDGLFTAFNEEEAWGTAHRVLAPVFGPIAIRNLYPETHEICCQLVSKWAKEGPETIIDPTVDFTKLTLDTIALCAMGTRFNSFMRDEMHPFPTAMAFFLHESGQRAMRPAFVNDYVYRNTSKKYWDSIELMQDIATKAIQDRRENPVEKKDLLNAMLYGKDPKTGETMSERIIMNNAITFLIAGHETTSGLLSFLFVMLLLNPQAMRSAREEVDRVVGQGQITVEHMTKLPYMTACLRETLRLWPTAPYSRRAPKSKNDADFPLHVGKDQYEIHKEDVVVLSIMLMHRDPAVYENPESFIPERMLDENFEKLPPNAWKPFGSGARSCIGRAFAWQEAMLCATMILQSFDLFPVDPSYQMDYKSTLTIKPKDFAMRARLRSGLTPAGLERRLWGGKDLEAEQKPVEPTVSDPAIKKQNPMCILFGSNTGTCESQAASLASAAASHGFAPRVRSMDEGIEEIKKDQLNVVITASYEGEPPDNACHFAEWLKNQKEGSLKGAKFAVFGCGNKDWVNTFHKVPIFVDTALSNAGATRVAKMGLCDVSEGHFFDEFDAWADSEFWPGVEKIYGTQETAISGNTGLDLELETGARASDLRSDVREAIVLENKVLTAPGEPIKKHIKIQLPSGSNYKAGDYLAVLPVMHEEVVRRVMAHFQIPWDTRVTLGEGQHTFLPMNKSMPVSTLLSAYVELNLPCTKKNLATLAAHIEDEKTRKEVESISAEEIAAKRMSILDVLEQYPACLLSFGDYLSMLSRLRVRQYSISSTPLESPEQCTLTYGVLDQEAKVGGGKRFLGAASNYLAQLKAGDRIQVAVRPSHQAFHPPADVENVPVIMICAGSGLAPFYGFAAERAKQKEAGRPLAPALLFVGCRSPDRDALYAEQLAQWARDGVVDVRYAFSRDEAKSDGCKYVQDRLWKDRNDARALWGQGANMYVCGNGSVGDAVKECFIQSTLESKNAMEDAAERDKAEKHFNSIRNERFASDVFA